MEEFRKWAKANNYNIAMDKDKFFTNTHTESAYQAWIAAKGLSDLREKRSTVEVEAKDEAKSISAIKGGRNG